MSWRWQPESGAYAQSDLESAGLVKDFNDQAAAEAWLTLYYDDLLHQGVAEVSLFEGDRLVYGPMALDD